MPRKARAKSESGIYHVMLRGINQQQIFEEDADYDELLQIIAEYKETSEFELYAYCLMSNHIHLLIKEKNARHRTVPCLIHDITKSIMGA